MNLATSSPKPATPPPNTSTNSPHSTCSASSTTKMRKSRSSRSRPPQHRQSRRRDRTPLPGRWPPLLHRSRHQRSSRRSRRQRVSPHLLSPANSRPGPHRRRRLRPPQIQRALRRSPEQGAADLAAAGFTGQDALVGIAASGRTPYVLGALAYANHSAPSPSHSPASPTPPCPQSPTSPSPRSPAPKSSPAALA